jgi:hypothetical protein
MSRAKISIAPWNVTRTAAPGQKRKKSSFEKQSSVLLMARAILFTTSSFYVHFRCTAPSICPNLLLPVCIEVAAVRSARAYQFSTSFNNMTRSSGFSKIKVFLSNMIPARLQKRASRRDLQKSPA